MRQGGAVRRRRSAGRPYSECVPELPEVEITARLLDRAVKGARIESALAPGINALKSYDPPLSALEGERVEGVRRRGKHLLVEVSGGVVLLIHLMSAGRLQLFDKRASLRDRRSPLSRCTSTPRRLPLWLFSLPMRFFVSEEVL